MILVETMFFPPAGFWLYGMKNGGITLEAYENYQKRSYRNRCIVMSSHGPKNLSIPLLKGKNEQCPITDVTIDHTQNWTHQHWRTLLSCYGKSPYWEHYKDWIYQLLHSEEPQLWNYNLEVIQSIRDKFFPDLRIHVTADYQKETKGSYLDCRNLWNQRNRLDSEIIWHPYFQVFSDRWNFQPNLSILDLIFCLGPELGFYIAKHEFDH